METWWTPAACQQVCFSFFRATKESRRYLLDRDTKSKTSRERRKDMNSSPNLGSRSTLTTEKQKGCDANDLAGTRTPRPPSFFLPFLQLMPFALARFSSSTREATKSKTIIPFVLRLLKERSKGRRQKQKGRAGRDTSFRRRFSAT